MEQQSLWAAPNQPKVLRISLERLWTEGDDVFGLSVASTGTKTSEALWISTETLRGLRAAPIAARIIEAHVLRFDSLNWATKPQAQAQERWERHLYTF